MVSGGVYLALLALIVVERLVELFVSRRHMARALRAGAVEHGASHYRAMQALHALFLVACALEASVFPHALPRWAWLLALGALLFAQALRGWTIATLGERWTTRVIIWPAAPPVVGGPYRFLRHPNYLAVVIEFVAIPLVGGAILTALVFTALNAWLLQTRIRIEERALGPTWHERFSHLPRFVPGGRS